MNDTMLLFLVAREGHASTVLPDAAAAAAASGRDYVVADPRLHTVPILDFAAAAVKEDSSLMETDETGVVFVVAAAGVVVDGSSLDKDYLKEETFQDNNTH